MILIHYLLEDKFNKMKEEYKNKINNIIDEYRLTTHQYSIVSEEALNLKDRIVDLELQQIELDNKLKDIQNKEKQLLNEMKINDIDSYIEFHQNINNMILNNKIKTK